MLPMPPQSFHTLHHHYHRVSTSSSDPASASSAAAVSDNSPIPPPMSRSGAYLLDRRSSLKPFADDNDNYIPEADSNAKEIKVMLLPVSTRNMPTDRRRVSTVAFLINFATWLFTIAVLLFLPWDWLAECIRREANLSDSPSASPLSSSSSALLSQLAVCTQEPPLLPRQHTNLDEIFQLQYRDARNTSYSLSLAERLAGLVRINTATFDDMKGSIPDPDTDERRVGMIEIREYLSRTWPNTHSVLSRDIVNQYGLVYTWPGSDASKRPLLLMAHLDTVPVPAETQDLWTYPPWGGIIADGYIHGRGAHDCKAQIAAVMDAVETLVSNQFVPTRTVIIAFGFDEEISGKNGAGEIMKVLHARYGDKGISLVVDEGTGIEDEFALVSTAEKGYLDLQLVVETPGGHSSVPPPHTGIGIAAAAVTRLEAQSPFFATLPDDSPLLGQLKCQAAHGKNADPRLKSAIDRLSGANSDAARDEIIELISTNDVYRSSIVTTQATDIINGGVKANSLPEIVTALINYRIKSDSSIAETESLIADTLAPLASLLNVTIVQLRNDGSERAVVSISPHFGKLSLRTLPDAIEPSPRSLTTAPQYKVMAGTIRHALVWENQDLFVTPTTPTGNTDTRYVHRLAENVYRFSPLRQRSGHNVHTVNERVPVRDVVGSSGFFFELIRNVDEATDF